MNSFDVELAKQPSKKKQKTIFRAFLDDFERQQFDLSERTKDDLEGRKWIVGTLYTFDMLLCYCIIGKHIGQISFLIASKILSYSTVGMGCKNTPFADVSVYISIPIFTLYRTISCGFLERHVGYVRPRDGPPGVPRQLRHKQRLLPLSWKHLLPPDRFVSPQLERQSWRGGIPQTKCPAPPVQSPLGFL